MAARFASTWLGAAIAILVFAAPTPLFAEPNPDNYFSKTFSACMDAAGGSTPPMHDCFAAEYAGWDKALNAVYQTRMASLDPVAKTQLRDEERAWLKRTKAKCEHAGDDEAGGSLQGIEIQSCYLDETILRTVYLRGLR
jgi:uncharacterized protein YecT (DUF1311 family)